MASGGRLQPASGRQIRVGVENRPRVRARTKSGGNRPQSAVNLLPGGINRGCGQIHEGREGEGEGVGEGEGEGEGEE